MNKRNRAILLGHARLAQRCLSQAKPADADIRREVNQMNAHLSDCKPNTFYAASVRARLLKRSKLSRLGRVFIREVFEAERHFGQPNGNLYTTKCLTWAAMSHLYFVRHSHRYSAEMDQILRQFHASSPGQHYAKRVIKNGACKLTLVEGSFFNNPVKAALRGTAQVQAGGVVSDLEVTSFDLVSDNSY